MNQQPKKRKKRPFSPEDYVIELKDMYLHKMQYHMEVDIHEGHVPADKADEVRRYFKEYNE